MTTQYPSDPDDAGDDEVPPELSERSMAAMALAQTPEQQEIARQIYDRLDAGDEVEDIKPLIEQMMRVVVNQRNGRPAAGQPEEAQGTTGVVGGVVGERTSPWRASDNNPGTDSGWRNSDRGR